MMYINQLDTRRITVKLTSYIVKWLKFYHPDIKWSATWTMGYANRILSNIGSRYYLSIGDYDNIGLSEFDK